MQKDFDNWNKVYSEDFIGAFSRNKTKIDCFY
jgi:hypothetical protein